MIREQVIQLERIVVTTTWLHSAEKVWAEKKGNGLHTYVGPSEFAEFYPVTEEEASSLLGINSSDWHSMDEEEVGSFIAGMKKLFGGVTAKSD